jgi:peroxiredoxin Q/BCP
MESRMTVSVGKPAPDFSMPSDGGGTVSLRQFKGQRLVLYFYPKDDTSGCTKEACGFSDALPAFKKLKAAVVGVSRDSVAAHDKFKAKYKLGIALGSDADGKASGAYGTWVEKSMYGRKYMGMERATFLIDEEGIVRGVWRKVKVPGHVEAVAAALAAL